MNAAFFYLKQDRRRNSGLPGQVVKKGRYISLFFLCLLFHFMPASGQTYFNVTNLSGTSVEDGISVTVTSTGTVSTYTCLPYWEGGIAGGGGYTWSFSTPVQAIRVHVDAIETQDTVTIMVNGTPYFLTSANVSPLLVPCFYFTEGAIFNGNLVDAGGGSSATIDINPGSGINSVSVLSTGSATDEGVLSDMMFGYNYPPSFVNGSPQHLSVCGNGIPVDISAMLAVNDIDTGNTETWSVLSGPSDGMLSVAYTATSTGSTLTPSGLTYAATSGYSGTDSFTIAVNDGAGGMATTTFYVYVNGLPTVSIDSIPAVCAGATSANLYFSGIAATGSYTFSSTGGLQTWTVPAGVTSVNIDAQGAAGGYNSAEDIYSDSVGYGGRVQATLAVTPGQVLNIYVGGTGGNGTGTGGGAGGYNGGGMGGTASSPYDGGGGGGATDIRIGDTLLTSRVIVAGAGGGAGLNCGGNYEAGGNGGDVTAANGGNGCSGIDTAGGGGTATAGGVGGSCPSCGGIGVAGTAGSLGMGGAGGDSSAGGGGGGGYYGGGGSQWEGGGGGSSYTDAVLASGVTHTQGYNTGSGVLIISYQIAATYSLVWSAAADTAGFTDVINDSLGTSPIAIAVPVGAAANTYTGTITVGNGTCTSAGYPASLTINALPTLSSPLTPASICDSTLFSYTPASTVAGTTFAWTRDTVTGISNPAGSGTDSIAETLVNNTANSIGVTYVYTLAANGCGSMQSIMVTVNPTPALSSTLSPAAVCDSTLFSYTFSSATPGTAFTWSRDTAAGISNPAMSGTGPIAEWLVNSTVNPVSVIYVDTLSANGCVNIQSFMVTVNPTPELSSPMYSNPVCDSSTYSYVPASLTPGTIFSWSRDTVAGITNGAAVGTGSINEILGNTTALPIPVVYAYILYANGCVNTQDVNVVVNPKPMLSSSLSPTAICDSTLFTYVPMSATPGTLFYWSRGTTAGISNAANSGTDTISEVLVNTTSSEVTVTYTDTLKANGCENIQNVTVGVEPKPTLTTMLSFPAICDSGLFTYVPASSVPGTVFTWSRGVIAGIGNPAASGIDSISEILSNTSSAPVQVTYVDTLSANGCINMQNITVTVNPMLELSSPANAPAICSGTPFNYIPMSSVTGATFTWERPFVLGIGLIAGSGSGNPDETLVNTTNDNLVVTYIFTITANGCTNIATVTDTVHPVPTLSSDLSATVCSGVPFNYYPTGFVFGTTYFWNRPYTIGLSPATDTGAGNIHETLTDSLLTPVRTVYMITLTANGCQHIEDVTLTVNPSPAEPVITTYPPNSLCSNTLYQNFGTATPAPSGLEYNWSAVNATVYATGSGHQYCLVNFNTPGEATITLNYNVGGGSCVTTNSYTVNVGTGVSDMPQVVYFDGQFVCLQNNEDSYQWGYDDNTTLDSTIISGEINPNYFINLPDLANKHYWVITMKDGCMQKSYYNTPTGITNLNSGELSEMTVYPNPTSEVLNVDINSGLAGNMEVRVLNILGQELNTTPVINHQARINVSSLPAGAYLIDCYREGVKMATARFIKN